MTQVTCPLPQFLKTGAPLIGGRRVRQLVLELQFLTKQIGVADVSEHGAVTLHAKATGDAGMIESFAQHPDVANFKVLPIVVFDEGELSLNVIERNRKKGRSLLLEDDVM